MKLFSLDLELNQPSRKVIQVGACAFSHKTGQIVDRFLIYVNPYEKLSPEITQLTGIHQKDVDTEGYSVKEAYFLLKKFVEKNKCFKNPIVWGSGTWNDSLCLYQQADPGEANFMGHRVIDAKTIYQSSRLRNWKKVKGGLVTAMEELGLHFEGKNHNALADAINTAKIWIHLTEVFKTGPRTRNPQGL
jgi:inhibitor of KinA sporulation pathway (predicted exonuclease)